jgi:hypothetical protein
MTIPMLRAVLAVIPASPAFSKATTMSYCMASDFESYTPPLSLWQNQAEEIRSSIGNITTTHSLATEAIANLAFHLGKTLAQAGASQSDLLRQIDADYISAMQQALLGSRTEIEESTSWADLAQYRTSQALRTRQLLEPRKWRRSKGGIGAR